MPKWTPAPRRDLNAIAKINEQNQKDGFVRMAGLDYNGILPIEAYLQKHGIKAIETKDSVLGWTALIAAARYGHLDVVRYLLEKGADVNAQANIGWSALHCAVSQGYTDVVRELIAYGVDVNMRDQDGKTPLMFAAEKGFADILSELIANGTDVNAQSWEGNTPLIFAVQNNQVGCVKELLGKRASIETLNSRNQTARIVALSLKKMDIVDLIEKEGVRCQRAKKERQIREIDFSRGLLKPMPIPASPFRKKPC